MSVVKPKYGSNNQAITCTLASLSNTAARSSAAIDNTSNLFLDALVQVKIKTGASGVSSSGYVNVYAYGTADGGTSYPDGAGTDSSITLKVAQQKLIGSIPAVANATTYISEPMSVAAAFGGVLPDHWGIIIDNESGAALDSTEGNMAKFYQGVQLQVV
jgi:hypothetical protein